MEHQKEPDNPAEHERESGSALIVAIAILFVMIVLGVALLNISSSERESSVSYSDKVQARMLAFSGIEHVRSNLSKLGRPVSVYHGEDWNTDGNDTSLSVQTVNGGSASGKESDSGDLEGDLDTENVDPKFALHPSFATTSPATGQPELIQMKEGDRTVYRGYTGALPASYGGLGMNTYSVRTTPERGININSLNPHLGTLINHLCAATDGCTGTPGTTIAGRFGELVVEENDPDGDGTPEQRVIETPRGDRPSLTLNLETYKLKGGYGSVKDLENVLKPAQFDALSGFFVVNDSVRVNRSTIRPKPQNTDLTFDERGDCGSDLQPYPSQNNCRDDDDDAQSQNTPGSPPDWSSDLLDPYPLPDRVPGEPKAIRGPSFENTSTEHPAALMTHTEQVKWVNEAGGTSPRDFPPSLSNDQVNQPYGAFRYNFDYRIQPRVPVQINSASTTVMKSLIRGIEARVIETTQKNVSEPGGSGQPYIETRWFNPMYQTRVLPQPGGEYTSSGTRNGHGISASVAAEIARKIKAYRNQNITIEFRGTESNSNQSYRGPFRTWPEFEAFIDQWVVDVDDGNWNGSIPNPVSNDVGYLLKAHFNPNTHFGKFNWNTNGQWTWVSDGKDAACSGSRCPWQGNRVTIDKTDFLYHTTEFTFLPPTHYRLQSYGRVTGPEGRIKAESSLEGIYRFGFARHTTQADFVVNEKPMNSNMTSYPENVLNVGIDNILNRRNSGSGLSGQLAIQTKRDKLPITRNNLNHWFEWGFDVPDQSTRGKYGVSSGGTDPKEFTVRNTDHPEQDPFNGVRPGDENDPHFPMAWFTREYNDVSDDQSEENYGLVGGKWTPDEHEDYPWDESAFSPPDNADPPLDLQPSSDPYNYSDITPDGALMTSDRYRSIRFLTTQWDQFADQSTAIDIIPRTVDQDNNLDWGIGHVEFWWKPRAATLTPSSGNAPAGDSKIIFPLWRHWILSRSQDLKPFAYYAPHRYVDDTGEDKFHRHTQVFQGDVSDPLTGRQPWYGYWKNASPDANPQSPPLGPVQGTAPDSNMRWAGGAGHGASQNLGPVPPKVSSPPVDENNRNRWAGYDCTFESGYSSNYQHQKFQNGQGTIARLSPETGCVTAYPGVQFMTDSSGHHVPGGAPTNNTDGDFDRTWSDLNISKWMAYEAHAGRSETGSDGIPFMERHRSFDDRNKKSLLDRQWISFHRWFDHTGHPTGSPDPDVEQPWINSQSKKWSTWPAYKLGDSIGYFFRSYYVKEPESSPRPSKWVFKISMEGFMDMDVGLRKKIDPAMSPEVTTDWRDVWQYDNQAEISEYGWGNLPAAFDLSGSESHPRDWGSDQCFPCPTLRDMTCDVCLEPGLAIATLNADTPEVTPKPGKWTHVVLEWDFRSIYDFYNNTGDCLDGVGCGDTYPIFVPWDFSRDTFTGPGHDGPGQLATNPNLTDMNDITNAQNTSPQWLPLVTLPVGEGTNIWHIATDVDNQDQNDKGTTSQNTSKWVVPHITVNGVKKDKTDLFMGNINPETGRFQPPFMMYAEHVVWSSKFDSENGSQTRPDVEEELWTGWQHLQHWTFKHFGQLGQFGSNLARKTKHYGSFSRNSNRKVNYNWARFYDDGFIEGTVDEVYAVNIQNSDSGGDLTFESFSSGRYVDPSTVNHVGRFHRGDLHDHGSQTYWDTDGDGSRDRYNHYAAQDQRVLAGSMDKTLRIERLAHTQYRPVDDHTGLDYHMDGSLASADDLSESSRPYFEVQFKSSGSNNWRSHVYSSSAAPDNRWLGEPVTPRDLSGNDLVLGSGEELMYRITVENGSPPTNITPFFESLTILYTGSSNTGMGKISYYTPN